MSRVVAFHSFRGGTGKSNTTANVAVLAAMLGVTFYFSTLVAAP